ncbi:YcjF family protein [Thaumasiovibrio sp. DFM-14]|uniref:YcjF family protein n=1 Tax=Thaumasiovibrio sp. DFM-14 TaxID=3384792 RepID=UPI00399F6E32
MKLSLFQRLYKAVVEPEPDIEPLNNESVPTPILWLLGKSGAGKSSLIQALTSDSDIEVGNGYQPCTKTAQRYLFPPTRPLVGFLDSRGLDEADYDPAEDIAYCLNQSHAVVVVVALDDPEQSSVIEALKQIAKQIHASQCLLVFSRKSHIKSTDIEKSSLFIAEAIKQNTGLDIPWVCYDRFNQDDIENVKVALSERLPELHLWLMNSQAKDAESRQFQRVRSDVLWYAGAAAASDTLPGVGLISVPTVQGKLLHTLGRKYDVEWDKAKLASFSSALGVGMLLRYGGQFGGRQLTKLIPWVGQTVGSATAAVISFSTTYALGRVACYFLYQEKNQLPVDPESLQLLYKQALTDAHNERGKS